MSEDQASPRGWKPKVRQRLRRGELLTTISAEAPGVGSVETGMRGPLDGPALAMLLRVMARRIEQAERRLA